MRAGVNEEVKLRGIIRSGEKTHLLYGGKIESGFGNIRVAGDNKK